MPTLVLENAERSISDGKQVRFAREGVSTVEQEGKIARGWEETLGRDSYIHPLLW